MSHTWKPLSMVISRSDKLNVEKSEYSFSAVKILTSKRHHFAALVFSFVMMAVTPLAVFALNDSPQTFTLDGQLYQAGTSAALLDANVKVDIQIINPDGTCLLYEETQTLNTIHSEGYFHLNVGSSTGAAKRTVNDPGRTMNQIFQNISAIPATDVPGQTCAGGAYTPAAGAIRYFRIVVTPSKTNVADVLTPDLVMDAVPQAMVAQSVQGLERSSILQTSVSGSTVLSQANLEALFTTPAYTNLQSILGGNFIKTDGSGAALPAYAAAPAGLSAGDIWYDSTLNQIKFYNGLTSLALGVSGATGNITSSDVTTALGYTAVNKAGDSMSGPLINNSNSASTALVVSQAGSGNTAIFMGGKVGVGNASPSGLLDVLSASTSTVPTNEMGFSSKMTLTPPSNSSASVAGATIYGQYGGASTTSGSVLGVFGSAANTGTGKANSFTGGLFSASGGLADAVIGVRGIASATSPAISVIGMDSNVMATSAGISEAVGLNVSFSGTVPVSVPGYGVKIAPINGVPGNVSYGIYQMGSANNNYFAGNVGIGRPTPSTALDISGSMQASGQVAAGSKTITGAAASANIDWNNGNAISTSYDCTTQLSFANLKDGGTYTLVVTDATTNTCYFSTTTTGVGAGTVTYRYLPANDARTINSHTVYTLMRVGSVVYVSWATGF